MVVRNHRPVAGGAFALGTAGAIYSAPMSRVPCVIVGLVGDDEIRILLGDGSFQTVPQGRVRIVAWPTPVKRAFQAATSQLARERDR